MLLTFKIAIVPRLLVALLLFLYPSKILFSPSTLSSSILFLLSSSSLAS